MPYNLRSNSKSLTLNQTQIRECHITKQTQTDNPAIKNVTFHASVSNKIKDKDHLAQIKTYNASKLRKVTRTRTKFDKKQIKYIKNIYEELKLYIDRFNMYLLDLNIQKTCSLFCKRYLEELSNLGVIRAVNYPNSSEQFMYVAEAKLVIMKHGD